jgi:7-cyano-7-deazaguanine synthase in queuosine biosynthesis
MSLKISVDKSWRNIAISISGGCDSALLTYLICSQVTDKTTIHLINNIRCWKTKPWQQDDFQRVYLRIKAKFHHIRFQIHKNFVPPELEWGSQGRTITDEYGKLVSGDTLELRSFAEYVCIQNGCEAYYNGVTRNPKNVDFVGMDTRDIDKTEDNAHLEHMVHMGVEVFHPFRFIDKSEIVRMYKELDIMDLFNLTRSCEGTFNNIDYTNYKVGTYVPVCNECFWCKERNWAIEQSK